MLCANFGERVMNFTHKPLHGSPYNNLNNMLLNTNYKSNDLRCQIFFRNIKDEIIEKIGCYPIVCGCVAWVTHPDIIDALSKKDTCLIIQKEDFITPATYYPLSFNRTFLGNISPIMLCGYDMSLWSNKRPNMHNKFVVFLDSDETPRAVITGSFNFTAASCMSLDNAVYMSSDAIAMAYFNEFKQILTKSTKLF